MNEARTVNNYRGKFKNFARFTVKAASLLHFISVVLVFDASAEQLANAPQSTLKQGTLSHQFATRKEEK